MGAGNFYPNVNDGEIYEMVYVDNEELQEEWDYQDLLERIKDILTAKFNSFTSEFNGYRGQHRSAILVMTSNLVDVYVADNQWSVAIFIVPTADIEERVGLANKHTRNYAKVLFNELNRSYNLRVRAGAWTSGRYENDEK